MPDKFYETNKDYIKKKSQFYVNFSPDLTLPRQQFLGPLCSKGDNTCRHSNARAQAKI